MADEDDLRAKDTLQLSTADSALRVIDSFRKPSIGGGFLPGAPPASHGLRNLPAAPHSPVTLAPPTSPWTTLDRNTVADDLEAIIRDPRTIYQSNFNLCGPAAFFNIVAGRHPVAFAQAAASLFDYGTCSLGFLKIAPDRRLLTKSFAYMCEKLKGPKDKVAPTPPTQGVWMLLSALRNTTKAWWHADWLGDPGQTVAGMTRPSELKSWFDSTGFFSNVLDQTTYLGSSLDGGQPHMRADIDAATNLTLEPGADHALLIHVNMINQGHQSSVLDQVVDVVTRAFPDHWITLLSKIVVDTTGETVTLSVWTWGQTLQLKVPKNVFLSNYYGSVTTKIDAKYAKPDPAPLPSSPNQA
jgi:hypothetical protein